MNLLALDTSTEMLSLALGFYSDATHDAKKSDSYALLTRDIHAGQSHSRRILPEIEAMLQEAGMHRRSLQGIVFGMGPGSFTGLRIACGVAQGLAFGLDIPVLGIGSLLAIADAAGADKVLAALDARMGEVYVAAYRRTTNNSVTGSASSPWEEVIPPCLCAPQELPALPDSGWIGAGTGWEVYGDVLLTASQGRVTGWQAGIHPQASHLLTLARPRLLAGEGASAAEVSPLYVRNKVALTREERAA